MPDKVFFGTPIKCEMRRRTTTPGRRYSAVLDLCSGECGSILQWLKEGNIDRKTRVVIVERDRTTAAHIRQQLAPIFDDITVIEKALEDPGWDFDALGAFDLVNLDTCSALSMELLRFVSGVHLKKGGELNLWVTGFRGREWLRTNIENAFRSSYDLVPRHSESWRNGPHGKAEDLYVWMAVYYSMRYDGTWTNPIRYENHQTGMKIYRVVNIQRPAVKKPSTFDLLPSGRKSRSVFEICGDSIASRMIRMAMGRSTPQERSALSEQMRSILRARDTGKSPVMVVAGWKAASRRACSNIYPPWLARKAWEQVSAMYEMLAV